MAWIEWLPGASAAVVMPAEPLLRVAVPRVVKPSMNVTVPVGIAVPGMTVPTADVRVTAWPKTEGLIWEEIPVAAAALFTICVSAVDTLARKLASPA